MYSVKEKKERERHQQNIIETVTTTKICMPVQCYKFIMLSMLSYRNKNFFYKQRSLKSFIVERKKEGKKKYIEGRFQHYISTTVLIRIFKKVIMVSSA